jgi:DNA anti-recombination protein RmuC
MDANQAKAAKQEETQVEIGSRMTKNLKEMDADRKRDRDYLKVMMAEISAQMDGNQAEMRFIVCTFRSELKETNQHEMKAVIHPIPSELDEMNACNGATETEPDPGMM